MSSKVCGVVGGPVPLNIWSALNCDLAKRLLLIHLPPLHHFILSHTMYSLLLLLLMMMFLLTVFFLLLYNNCWPNFYIVNVTSSSWKVSFRVWIAWTIASRSRSSQKRLALFSPRFFSPWISRSMFFTGCWSSLIAINMSNTRFKRG